jgi:hypothetical protein
MNACMRSLSKLFMAGVKRRAPAEEGPEPSVSEVCAAEPAQLQARGDVERQDVEW